MPGVVIKTLTKRYDYQVRIDGSDVVLRVTVPPPARFGAGDAVTLAVAPEACVPLTGSDDGGVGVLWARGPWSGRVSASRG